MVVDTLKFSKADQNIWGKTWSDDLKITPMGY